MGDSTARVGQLADAAASMGMSALALTDHDTLQGSVAFHVASKKRGIKPIHGIELTVGSERSEACPPISVTHIVLLAENSTGYQNLIALVTRAHRGSLSRPHVEFEFLAQHCRGLVGLSACLWGEIPGLLLRGMQKDAEVALEKWTRLFGRDRFFIELQNHGIPEQRGLMPQLLGLARRLRVGVVATNDVHYVTREHARAHEILLAGVTGATIDDPTRVHFPTDEFWLKSGKEMAATFCDIPEALANSRRVADLCSVDLDLGTLTLPKLRFDNDLLSELAERCRAGLSLRGLGHTHLRLLETELRAIDDLGLTEYFILGAKILDVAKAMDIAVLPPHRSAGSCLVGFVLGLTADCSAGRGPGTGTFLDRKRLVVPSLDLDVDASRRDELVDRIISAIGGEYAVRAGLILRRSRSSALVLTGRVLGLPRAVIQGVAESNTEEPEGEKKAAQAVRSGCGSAASETLSEWQRATAELVGLPCATRAHPSAVVAGRRLLAGLSALRQSKVGRSFTELDVTACEQMGLLRLNLQSRRFSGTNS